MAIQLIMKVNISLLGRNLKTLKIYLKYQISITSHHIMVSFAINFFTLVFIVTQGCAEIIIL